VEKNAIPGQLFRLALDYNGKPGGVMARAEIRLRKAYIGQTLAASFTPAMI
jgi:hypothetical protein